MHILIFLGCLLGVIGWFALWIYIADDAELGVAMSIGVALGLFALCMLGWGLWNIT